MPQPSFSITEKPGAGYKQHGLEGRDAPPTKMRGCIIFMHNQVYAYNTAW